MTTGFGVDATVDGTGKVTSGTSAWDVRRVWGGLIATPGIISGAVVSTSTTGMQYSITDGVVAIKPTANEIIPVPVFGTTLTTLPAPSSGTRTDYIYVQQRYPSIDGDSEVVLGVGQSIPDRAQLLKAFFVSAGQTKTSQAVQNGGVDYAIPYGASLGTLFQNRDTFNGKFTTTTTIAQSQLYVPTDRLVKVSVLASVSADAANGFDNSKYCEASFRVYLDNVSQWRWNTPGLHQAWGHYYWEDTLTLTRGVHTLRCDRGRQVGPGTPYQHYQAGEMPGTLFTVDDIGPAV